MIWGIGMSETDKDVEKEYKWGLNWLGEVLTKVRDYYKDRDILNTIDTKNQRTYKKTPET